MKFGGPIDMLHGSLWDKVLAFTLPLVATALLQQLYNGADLTVLGQFVGKQAMAAVGNDIPVVGLFLSLALSLIIGILLLVVGQVFAVPALHLLGVPKEILPERNYTCVFIFPEYPLSAFTTFRRLYFAVAEKSPYPWRLYL